MDYTELVQAMQSVDAFHKNLILMFEDLVARVREKAYQDSLTDITNEGGYTIWDPNVSEHKRVWIFSHNRKIRFAVMLITADDRRLKEENATYKAMSTKLGRDPKHPLILSYGVFNPRTLDAFNNDLSLRRHWVENVLLMNLHEDHSHTDIESINFGDMVTLESPLDTPSWQCEGAKYIICDLLTIIDSNKLEKIADHLLSL